MQINIACTYTSVQFYEHHLCKLHKHIFLIIFHCTLHYICSFVLCTLLIGGNKELLLLLLLLTRLAIIVLKIMHKFVKGNKWKYKILDQT